MDINLADPDLYATADGGLEALRSLQRARPVYWNAASTTGFWALTRYADAVTVYRNPKSFTSRQGIQVGQLEDTRLPAAGKMLVLADTGEHQRIKALMSRHLSPAALQRLLPEMRSTAREALTRHTGEQAVDFVTEIAGQLTMTVIGALLGVPARDRPDVARWTSLAFDEPPVGTAPAMSAQEANAQLFAYFADLLHPRRDTAHADDLISALAAPATGRHTRLSTEEILFNVHLLLAGGQETTRQAVAGCAAAFSNHPDQWERLRADDGLLDTAVEEVLRWSAPSLNVMRTATRDITIGTTTVRAGEQVTVWHPIVNRDEEVFPHADAFDIAREPNRHLSFGMGSHFCLGAWLARQELRVLMQEMLACVARLEPAGPPRRSRSRRTWGYDCLPMRLVPVCPAPREQEFK
ncbi:cytochrome P450 [Streptomyces sp. NPDC056061]|uniref:cytochrome P450 n=1 Tax=Streptomyces sp. NPDC056061 TaxID=3345700 RepID=UPI0035DA3BF4